MKKIAVVGTVGIPACYGGFESLVENLTINSSEGLEYTVFCSKGDYEEPMSSHNGAKLVYLPIKANGIQSIFYDVFSLVKVLKLKSDVVLILGVSGCCFLPLFKLFSRSRIVTNIDGLEWKRDKWPVLAQKFLKFSERLAVKYSDFVVTDNLAITKYVHKEYGIDSKTIAYGGDHAIRSVDLSSRTKETYALGLCRIEPENNVELILEAFSELETPLKFVGNWDNSEFGRSLKSKYNEFKNIDLIDPIYDLDTLYILRKNCSLYLHGHSAGGTNPSLVEVMHFGCPIYLFDCDFNRHSTDNKAHYFSDTTDLISLVKNTEDSVLKKNGEDMLSIARLNYNWTRITEQYESLFLPYTRHSAANFRIKIM